METRLLSSHRENECVTNLQGFYNLVSMAETRAQKSTSTEQLDFLSLLSDIAPHSLSSDPRDSIYAFIGLIEDEDVKIEPDYQLDMIEVRVGFAESFIEGKRNLDILAFCPRMGDDTRIGYHTWAPDWARPESAISLSPPNVTALFAASGTREHHWITHSNVITYSLGVKGRIIAEIEYVGPLIRSDDHWTDRDVCKFLQLHTLSSWARSVSPSGVGMDRLLGVAVADGVLLRDNMEKGTQRLLSDSEILDLAEFYRLLSASPKSQHRSDPRLQKLQDLSRIALNRRFFVTDSDLKIGLGSAFVVPGDKVCILYGSKTPVVLRTFNPFITNATWYKFVGQYYLEDSMHGEAMY
jgi:hypothetical protein